MKVHVDPERCQGHTLCAMIAPDMFELDEVDGHSSPVSEHVPEDQEAKVAKAVRSCPEQAISTRHTPDYRHRFEAITAEMQARCPIAWSDTYGGHWVAAGNREVFDLARSAEYLSNDHDVNNERRGYQGITIPTPEHMIQGGFLEMDPPEQRQYRQALNPYLSPAAVGRWVPRPVPR